MARKSPTGLPITGVFLLDKPLGLSSNQALQTCKRLLQAQKAGHTGSLDPRATGLLPLCFGRATKIAGLFLKADKSYHVTIQLGVETASGDSEGAIVRQSAVTVSETEVRAALVQFTGSFTQIPPMYSALKHHGQPLYKLARQGREIARAPRPVTVHSLTVGAFRGDSLILDLTCSKGFYVRSLAMDLGRALGCGGHVATLRRTGFGAFHIHRAITIAELEQCEPVAHRQQWLLTIEDALADVPKLTIPENHITLLRSRQAVPVPPTTHHGLVRLFTGRDRFIGLGELSAHDTDTTVTATRLFG